MRNEPWIVDRPQARTASSHAVAIVGLRLCGGAARHRLTDHGLIFPTVFGNPSDPDTFSHLFSELAKKAKLGHWHPHELRHSGASLMLAQGTPLHVVSEVLGHASISITKDVYGHLLEGDKRAATEAISGALLGNSGRWLPR
ncbi:hypothetical protein FAF44_04210 [Nonomuraea sp. MG754425]|uniref:tyrosine-type recombinase/integrase n=1 Tax=Nonomuraea sp. MG754425 TaxID=2570319 RepID=UPI001EFFAC04|nr:tyrosine-type recombinase/integrase [Nonomuraea sp. MG754425]MCF6467616.1 hypothetical protein [Nonomuraea sp. MG754425]